MSFYYLDLIGVAVFAISGALAAGRKQLDWVGVVFLATVTAIGGGTVRDVLLNRDAVFWIQDPTYLWVIISASFLTILYVRFFRPPFNLIMYVDALGLALFTILGAQVAEAHGVSDLIVIVMAVLTGVAGGVIRDVLTGEIPHLFRSTEPLYSVAALTGAVIYVLLQKLGVITEYATYIGISMVALFRFAAIYWNLNMPMFSIDHDKNGSD